MGLESFRVELRGGSATLADVQKAIEATGQACPDPEALPAKGSVHYLLRDSRHVIEIEALESPVRLSCRFTLAHPPSIDAVFLGWVRELMTKLGMAARICDDESTQPFTVAEFPKFAAAAVECIAVRRAEWIAAFGDQPMAATTTEVHRKVILPHCQPMEQPTFQG